MEKNSNEHLPTTGVIVVALVAAGAFFAREIPWQGSRPAAVDPKPYRFASRQDIDARLWQDPLSAVARGREDVRKRSTTTFNEPKPSAPASTAAGDHRVEKLAQEICDQQRPVSILAVMVQGGSYVDSVESRRRARYATLAGLKESGYVPSDSAHLGYVLPKDPALPEFIAYEWMEETNGRSAVLTLWLDEYVFATRTTRRIERLRGRLFQGTACMWQEDVTQPALAVIGPAYSSTLQDMTKDAASIAWMQRGPVFYAYGATADDAHILSASSPSKTLAEAFGGTVFRTVVDDNVLTQALEAELCKRGVRTKELTRCPPRVEARPQHRKPDHVVLISEWDTLYGRSLPALMTNQLVDPCCQDQYDRTSSYYVHRYSFLRGLDGQLPTLESKAQTDAQEGGTSTAGGSAGDRTRRSAQIERPEGQGQYDYLRRLSFELAALDQQLRTDGDGGIKAIGVLGSDVFDKLLILQALRPQFQSVIFFTTDLDARMLHPQEQDWARNLVVASSFGLSLQKDLQKDIPPFRDTYQTSIYLSTRIALVNLMNGCGSDAETRVDCIGQATISKWLKDARVFEIGRSVPFDFAAAETPEPCLALSNGACRDIQPAGSERYKRFDAIDLSRIAFVLVLGSFLMLRATRLLERMRRWNLHGRLVGMVLRTRVGTWCRRYRRRRWLTGASRTGSRAPFVVAGGGMIPTRGELRLHSGPTLPHAWSRLSKFALGIALAVVVVRADVLYLALADRLTEHGGGEPISLLEGISVWPTAVIRLFAFGFAVMFVVWAWALLDRNLHEIATKLKFVPTHARMLARVRKDCAGWSIGKRIVAAFSFRLVDHASGSPMRDVGLSWSAQRFWKQYIYEGMFLSRCARVAFAVLCYFVLGSTVIKAFGFPNTPFRGDVSQASSLTILAFSVGAMLIVIFFVVDATVFCHQLIKALRKELVTRSAGDPIWAASTMQHYASELGMDARLLAPWILVDFIALRTRLVAKLVYFPFIVVSLMALSRSRLFDNWTMPLGLVLVLTSSVAIVVGCAIMLRQSAEAARADALRLLHVDHIRLQGVDSETARQVESLIARVEAMRIGAFAPYTQQPILRALLLPLSTFGGTALLDYLTLYNV